METTDKLFLLSSSDRLISSIKTLAKKASCSVEVLKEPSELKSQKRDFVILFVDGKNEEKVVEVFREIKGIRGIEKFTVLLLERKNTKLIREVAPYGLNDFLITPVDEDKFELILSKALLAREFGQETTHAFHVGASDKISRKAIVVDQLPSILKDIDLEEVLRAKLDGIIEKFDRAKGGIMDLLIREVEKIILKIALEKSGGNKVKASKLLGINRNTLGKKIKEYRLEKGFA